MSEATSANPTHIAEPMSEARPRRNLWPAVGLVLLVAVLAAAYAIFRGDLIRYSLDPRIPFQTYRPPPAPDYAQPTGWWLAPAHPEAPAPTDPAADVFFVAPTSFDGGKNWNAPPNDPGTERVFREV